MNPLTPLPASYSNRFSLNWVDIEKLWRTVLTSGIGYFLTLGVPALMNKHWVIDGTDYTAVVWAATPIIADALRRFLSGFPKD